MGEVEEIAKRGGKWPYCSGDREVAVLLLGVWFTCGARGL